LRRLIACALAIAPGLALGADEIAGYVLMQRGSWSVQGGRSALAVGAPVAPGARLVVSDPAAGDRLVVVDARSGALLVQRQCDLPPGCAVPLVVPAGPARADVSPLTRNFERIVARFASEPDRYVATISRGESRLADAIVPWQEAGVDLAPVLASLPEGRYGLRVATLRCRPDVACPGRALQTQVDWSPGGAAIVRDLAPGLYELLLGRPSSAAGPPRARAWLLLIPAAQHARAEARYRADSALVEAWGDAVDAATKQGMTRAVLDALAET
jgi:hypothetical protein